MKGNTPMTLTFEEYLQLHSMRGETEVSFELDMKPFCEYLDLFCRDITHKKFIDWYEIDEMNRIATRCASLHIRGFRELKEKNK